MTPQELRLTPIEGGLEVEGELDIATQAALSDALDEALRTASPVLLDVSKLTFMDSSGLHCLLRATRNANGQPKVVLVRPSVAVMRVLEIVIPGGAPGLEVRAS